MENCALQVAVKKNDARGRREDPGWAAILGGILLLILLTATLGCRTRVDAPVEEGTLGSQSEAVTNTTADNLPPVDDRCMQDIYDKFGQGGALTCTANDVSVAAVSNVTVLDDGCRFVGDTVTFNADIDVQVTASTRHDVGVYLGSHGDALHGECKIATLPVAPNNEACTGAGVPFACCTGRGTEHAGSSTPMARVTIRTRATHLVTAPSEAFSPRTRQPLAMKMQTAPVVQYVRNSAGSRIAAATSSAVLATPSG